MKYKILHLIKSLGRGGAETLLPETLRYHNKTEFDFEYAYFLPWKNQLVERIQKEGAPVHLFKAANNIQLILKANQLLRFVKKEKIDLIHCHLPWAGFAGRLLHQYAGIPVIYTEHNKQERYHFVTRWLNRQSFNWQSSVIAVSNDVAASIKNNIAPSVTVQLIQNAVDTDHFSYSKSLRTQLRKQWDISEDAFVIGTVAVFRSQKRLLTWLEVIAEIVKHNPSVKAVLVGDGPMRKEIELKARQLRLQGKLLLPGLQTDVKPWLAAMDVFMMTSEFEGLPVALLEAMSMGCIPACTSAGGIPEVIVPDINGLLVPVAHPELLIPAVSKLYHEQAHQKLMRSNARKRITDEFGMQQMISSLENIYRKVLTR